MGTDPISFLASVAGYTRASTDRSSDRPILLGVIDPAYSSGLPKVTFEGESTLSVKGYPYAESYYPVAGDRVYLLPIGNTYLIGGKVDNATSNLVTTFKARLDAAEKVGVVAKAQGSAAGPNTTTAFVLDNIGTVVFTAVSGRDYKLCYKARMQTNAAAQTADAVIVDGGASAPTIASPVVTGASIYLALANGPGASDLKVEQVVSCPADITAGVHNLAAAYRTTVGAGTLLAGNQGGAGTKRQLWVEDMGLTAVL